MQCMVTFYPTGNDGNYENIVSAFHDKRILGFYLPFHQNIWQVTDPLKLL